MKKLILTLTFTLSILLCLGSSVFAQNTPIGGIGNSGGGPKQSWRDIMKNPNLKAIFPSYDILGRDVQYNRLCITGSKVRTIYKFVVDEFTISSKIIYDYLQVERVREVQRCVEQDKGDCLQWELVTIEIPYDQKIEVFKKGQADGPRETWELAFAKDFELPECRNSDL